MLYVFVYIRSRPLQNTQPDLTETIGTKLDLFTPANFPATCFKSKSVELPGTGKRKFCGLYR